MSGAGHVSLVGLSGTGKSTVAPLLAERLDRQVVDLDRAIESETGLEVAELFSTRGEAAFRELELAALRTALEGPVAVISTGGGVVTTPAAARLLADRSTVVWLRADPATLLTRLGSASERRPLLDGDADATLAAMARDRDPLYEEVADIVVGVDDVTPGEVIEQITTGLAAPPVAGGRRP